MSSSLEAAAAAAIWDELERQADRFGCVDRDQGFVDSRVDMAAVAAAVIEALALTEEWAGDCPRDAVPDRPQDRYCIHLTEDVAVDFHVGLDPIVRRFVTPWVAVDGSPQ